MKIYDTETGITWTLEDLKAEYNRQYANGDTEDESFDDYLVNITDKNGTCEWVKE